MDNDKNKVNKRGGKREGAGRPKEKEIRKNRTMRAFDEEWDIINRFATLVKQGNKEQCLAFVEDMENRFV